MTATIAAEIAELQFQLEQIEGALSADSENEELLTLQRELLDLITLTESKLQPLITTQDEQTGKRKFVEEESRAVGDSVLAKWVTGDHQFYPAKITSITGSAANPVYVVKFMEYNETQTLKSHQLKNLTEQKKRALDIAKERQVAISPIPPPPPANHRGAIPPPPPSEPIPKKTKPSINQELKKSASTWSNFAKSGPKTKGIVGRKKAIGESSMFRTNDDGRVGVIGSGKGMTADPGKREKHVFDRHRR